jgi:glycosyltransferase involved in cell wall biosynthesis
MNDKPAAKVDKILVSIIIATYNSAAHIRECLESIINQAEKNIEIVVVDGGSTDSTLSIIKEFTNQNIVYISEPDKGIYDALNKGVKISKGKWLYFMGTDDRLLPGFSEMASKLKDEFSVYYGNSEPYYYSDQKPSYELLSGEFSNYRLAKYCINHQAIIYPANAFLKYNYDLKYRVFADYALNLKVWGDHGFKKIFYPIAIARYNMTGFSSTVNDAQFKKDKSTLIRKSMGWIIYSRYLLKRFKKKLKGEKD